MLLMDSIRPQSGRHAHEHCVGNLGAQGTFPNVWAQSRANEHSSGRMSTVWQDNLQEQHFF